ncbi:MAG: leucyl/phenylalanyl-tRNA--protein transferase [Gammaproteobacteria bacterium]|nr:leucyl/phenylalanyl-tRNA--protein transferase [Gammaproteobacteria bacterium]
MHFLKPGDTDTSFPPVETATPEGLLAVGGDLSVERLLEAYRRGIFPWYNPGQPILWWSPDPRAVLYPEKLRVSRSLRKTLRRGHLCVTFDTAFREVMQACAAPRAQYPGGGTWITDDMVAAYCALHARGVAHSVEVWEGRLLAGGLYGISLGGVFFGESMFTRVVDASKVALVALADRLRRSGYRLIDCQVTSAHLTSLGAEDISRARFLEEVGTALNATGHPGRWSETILPADLIETEPRA